MVLTVPEGSVVSVIPVLPLLTFALPCRVSHTQAAQVRGEARLIGPWDTALLKETPHGWDHRGRKRDKTENQTDTSAGNQLKISCNY